MPTRILDVGAMYGYPCAQLFKPWNPKVTELPTEKPIDPKILDNLDLIIFGGGEDIAPKLYEHKNVASWRTYTDYSPREIWEIELVRLNRLRDKPVKMLGICRGAQFLCAMHGGWLVQDVNNHAGRDHSVVLPYYHGDNDTNSIVVNSYHHQMMVPPIEDSTILAYATNVASKYRFDTEKVGDGERYGFVPHRDAEIVAFSCKGKFCSIGIQGHPEYLDVDDPFAELSRSLVYRYLGVPR